VHPFCYWFRVEGMDFAAEQKYMKGDYLEMMWNRNKFQQTILELGYTFLFTVCMHHLFLQIKSTKIC
jgi:hypothetical protein